MGSRFQKCDNAVGVGNGYNLRKRGPGMLETYKNQEGSRPSSPSCIDDPEEEAKNDKLFPRFDNWWKWDEVRLTLIVERNKLRFPRTDATPVSDWDLAMETLINLRKSQKDDDSKCEDVKEPETRNSIRDWDDVLRFFDEEKGKLKLSESQDEQWNLSVETLKELRTTYEVVPKKTSRFVSSPIDEAIKRRRGNDLREMEVKLLTSEQKMTELVKENSNRKEEILKLNEKIQFLGEMITELQRLGAFDFNYELLMSGDRVRTPDETETRLNMEPVFESALNGGDILGSAILPTKRAKVDISSSHKEKSPCPMAVQRGPVMFTAVSTTPTFDESNNGDVGVESSTNNNGAGTSQELEQMIVQDDSEEDSDDNDGVIVMDEDCDSDGGSMKSSSIEETSAKPASRLEPEMNNEPVIESELQKSETVWGRIRPAELVFARWWGDNKYYPGTVKCKGLKDTTWAIDYDDGTHNVVPEICIIPAQLLGVGVNVIYSPVGRDVATPAVIIGQKFQEDSEQTAVKYAIRCAGDNEMIWCLRRQLSIKKADAKRLRREYIGEKADDVSTDNIMSRPRLRRPSRTLEGSPARASVPQERVVAGACLEVGKKRPKKILFQGMQFLLTAKGCEDTDNPMYDKQEYRELIENAGGEILDIVGSEAEKKENVFLISNSYARTAKYIYCLASSIPCVSHNWIKQCLDNLEIVDWSAFILPAGWSTEHHDLIAHHTKKPLKGCKLLVTSDSDKLYNYWKPVLTAAEAVILKLPDKDDTLIPNGTDVIVTDQHESDAIRELLHEADEQEVPVVEPEWLVQTIILGEKADLYGSLNIN